MTDPKTNLTKDAISNDPKTGTTPETTPAPPAEAAHKGSQPVSADMQAMIGRQLRAVFDDIAKQPVPDRFLELMRQLEAKSGSGVA